MRISDWSSDVCSSDLIDAEIATIIRRFNESVGGVNDDTQGYQDSITRAYVAGVRLFLSQTAEAGLAKRVNALLLSDIGRRDWPLRFYSRARLFSRSEEHTSELQSLMRISYAVFCLKKKTNSLHYVHTVH